MIEVLGLSWIDPVSAVLERLYRQEERSADGSEQASTEDLSVEGLAHLLSLATGSAGVSIAPRRSTGRYCESV